MIFMMIVFAFVMSITPGPVNMIILSSGINYGWKRTFPYVSGATIGFILLLLAVGLVLDEFVQTYPVFLKYLAVAGGAYIAYMGYKIAVADPTLNRVNAKVPKFHEGFMLQWINPKSWIACVSGAALFSSTESYEPFLTFSGIYFIICYLCLGAWAVLGDKIAFLLNSHFRLRVFNVVMGLLLIATAASSIFVQFR